MKQGAPVSQESLNNSRAVHSSTVKITQRPRASQAQGSTHHPSSVIGTRSSYPRPHHVVSEPLGGLGFDDLHLGSRNPSTIQQSSLSSHRKQGDKAKQQATRKRVAENQTLIFSEQQLDDLAAEIFNQIMRERGSKQRWNRSDLKTSKEAKFLALDQFGGWSRVSPGAKENIQLVPELSTNKVWKTAKETSKPCSQKAEKEPEKISETEPKLATPCQGEHSVIQLQQEEHVPVALCGHILDLTEAKEEGKLDAALVVHKESSETLIEQGGFIRFSSYYSLIRPLVCVRFSLMDHLKLVKELHNFVFEPGGKLCEFKSNNNILVQRATTELSMHEIFILKEQDLRSNPFKGGGVGVTQISSKDKMKESKSELHKLLKDLQLWPHHPRPRKHVIHDGMGSRESLYQTASMVQARISREDMFKTEFFTLHSDWSWLVGECGRTRDDPREARHGPRLKSEYGDHCTRPPDQENHISPFTLSMDQDGLRDGWNLLIFGHMGLVRPPENLKTFLDDLNNTKEHRSSINTLAESTMQLEKHRDGSILLDGLDLRTNPFKGGGDGATWISLNFKDWKLVCAPEKSLLMVCFNEPKEELNGLYQRRTHGTALKQPDNRGSMEQIYTGTKEDLLMCYLDQRERKDVLDLFMEEPKSLMVEDGPYKPKKWKDKPAWFNWPVLFSLGLFLISCKYKPIRIRIWFSQTN